MFKFLSILSILTIFISLILACKERQIINMPIAADYEFARVAEKKDLKVGVVPGPYGDMFMEAIMPSLMKSGYTASLVLYDDFINPNIALGQKEIDLNIFQHYAYLNSFKFENDLALSAISEIPTISMGIYSRRYRSVNEIGTGIIVSIPNDSTNLARALQVLESADIIVLNPFIDKSKATLDDIISNPRGIRLSLIDAHRLVDTLGSYDISVINGNFAMSYGLKPSEALYNEILAENYINVIAVRTEDLSSQFVRDIIEVLHSYDYKKVIINPDGKYADFQYPRSFTDRLKIMQVN